MPGRRTVDRPAWFHWWQLRDIAPVLICALILCAFLGICAVAVAHLLIAVMAHVRHALHHP